MAYGRPTQAKQGTRFSDGCEPGEYRPADRARRQGERRYTAERGWRNRAASGGIAGAREGGGAAARPWGEGRCNGRGRGNAAGAGELPRADGGGQPAARARCGGEREGEAERPQLAVTRRRPGRQGAGEGASRSWRGSAPQERRRAHGARARGGERCRGDCRPPEESESRKVIAALLGLGAGLAHDLGPLRDFVAHVIRG